MTCRAECVAMLVPFGIDASNRRGRGRAYADPAQLRSYGRAPVKAVGLRLVATIRGRAGHEAQRGELAGTAIARSHGSWWPADRVESSRPRKSASAVSVRFVRRICYKRK